MSGLFKPVESSQTGGTNLAQDPELGKRMAVARRVQTGAILTAL